MNGQERASGYKDIMCRSVRTPTAGGDAWRTNSLVCECVRVPPLTLQRPPVLLPSAGCGRRWQYTSHVRCAARLQPHVVVTICRQSVEITERAATGVTPRPRAATAWLLGGTPSLVAGRGHRCMNVQAARPPPQRSAAAGAPARLGPGALAAAAGSARPKRRRPRRARGCTRACRRQLRQTAQSSDD